MVNRLERLAVDEKQLHARVREALGREGYTFFVHIEDVSIGQLVTNEATSHFKYVSPSEKIRASVPPQMEIAINPENLRIKGSNCKSAYEQEKMLKEEEIALKARLPQGIRDSISMSMQSPSVLVQIDDRYQKETGRLLFTDWFGIAKNNPQGFFYGTAVVGRLFDPTNPAISVITMASGVGDICTFAVPVVRLPNRLAV